jgi:hypothetical protein
LQRGDKIVIQKHPRRVQRRRQKAEKAHPAFGGPESATRAPAPPRTETTEKEKQAPGFIPGEIEFAGIGYKDTLNRQREGANMSGYSHKWTGMFDEMERTQKALNRSIRRKKRKNRRADSSDKSSRIAGKAPKQLSASSKLWKHKLHDPAWSKSRWGYVLAFALAGLGIGALAYDVAVRPYDLFTHLTAGQLLTALAFGAAGALIGWIVGKRKRYSLQAPTEKNSER